MEWRFKRGSQLLGVGVIWIKSRYIFTEAVLLELVLAGRGGSQESWVISR